MLELLLCAGMALVAESGAYADDTLVGFVAMANDRVVDGASYANGNGVFSTGLLYGHPAGAFAGTELAAFEGGGDMLPQVDFTTLETFAGWRTKAFPKAELSMTLHDYRLRGEHARGYRGVSLAYHHEDVGIELGRDVDRPYYYPSYDRFFEHDVNWLSLGWTPALGDQLDLVLAVGAQSSSRTTGTGLHGSAGLRGRLGRVDWQLAVIHTDRSYLPGSIGDGDTHAVLRIAFPFRID